LESFKCGIARLLLGLRQQEVCDPSAFMYVKYWTWERWCNIYQWRIII